MNRYLLMTILVGAAILSTPASAETSSEDTLFVVEGAADRTAAHDPFRVLLTPPADPPPPIDKSGGESLPPPPAPEPPAQVTVAAFASEGSDRLAAVSYNGALELVEEGWRSPDGRVVVTKIDHKDDVVIVRFTDTRTNKQLSATLPSASLPKQ